MRTVTGGPADQPDPASSPADDRPLLLGLVLLALAVRLWLMAGSAGLTMDSPLYVRMAERFAGGPPAEGPAHHGYPALIALASRVIHGREMPGRLVSLLAGLLLVPIVYHLARRTLSPAWAGAAAALIALHPSLAALSGAIMTESSFLALTFGALLAIECGRAARGGALLGLAYLVRPEPLVIAPLAALLAGRTRRALALLGGFALLSVPYVAALSVHEGRFSLGPKADLVRPEFESSDAAELRVGEAGRADPGPSGLIARMRWAAPSIAAHYMPRLARHLTRLLETWPLPWLLLSLPGLAFRRGALLAPLAVLAALPLLTVPDDSRLSLVLIPALAVFAAAGAAWLAARLPGARLGAALAAALALSGLAWCWAGPAGYVARHLDDGPMPEMRAAGAWLRAHAAKDAAVMDRKAYVPFFAGLRHVQLPDDDYDTIIDYARKSGVSYLVVEEYVTGGIRPQLRPLLADRAFRERETRLRPAFAVRGTPGSGVAVFEVVRPATR